MKHVLVIVMFAVLGLIGCTPAHASDPVNPLIGTWVVDMDAMVSRMSSAGMSLKEIADFRAANGNGRTGFVITKDAIHARMRGEEADLHPYTLENLGAGCFAVRGRDSGNPLILCVQGNAMRLSREGPGIVLKRIDGRVAH